MKQPFSSLALMPQLQNTMTRMVNYYGDADKPLPPMFVTFPGAVQPEPLMENLCDELEQGGYVRFTGVKRWLNMRLDYTEDPKFPSFTRMLESMRRYAGYCNQYHGVVLIDLTQWMTHTSDRHFEDVLAYIHDYSDEVFFFLYVFADDTQRPESMKNAIGRWLYAPCVDVEHL
ncbi:MAG: hypothetical protein IIU00_05990, partial [Clostridia bacterium]|nr:hypothetical protein [Clostridia bacterium]